MSERARECAKCEHHIPLGSPELDDDWPYRCLKGHRPRYYRFIREDEPPDGYRRVCEDFEERGKG